MFLEYFSLSSFLHLDQLPHRIQSMYEPFIWILGSSYLHIIWGRSDGILTRWRLLMSLSLLLGAYMLGKLRSKRIAWLALIICALSFAQYAVYWWSYWKQLLGLFFVCITLRSRSKNKIWQTIPFLITTALINRAWALLLGGIALIRSLHLIYRKQRDTISSLIASICIAELIALPILLPFLDAQIIPLLQPFFDSIDIPMLNDGYQAGGSFLTLWEYRTTSRYLWIGGIRYFVTGNRKQVTGNLVVVASLILILWVFGQGFFFQRMIGYLDLFLCVLTAVALSKLADLRRWKGMIWIFFTIQIITTFYWWNILHMPIIEQSEFAFINKEITKLSSDSTIIVPSIWYSPRIRGRSSGQVIAPGLFDTNRRWDASQWWTQRRYNQTPEIKCHNLKQDYPEIINTPVYVRIGSKGEPDNYSGACFHVIVTHESPPFVLYKIKR